MSRELHPSFVRSVMRSNLLGNLLFWLLFGLTLTTWSWGAFKLKNNENKIVVFGIALGLTIATTVADRLVDGFDEVSSDIALISRESRIKHLQDAMSVTSASVPLLEGDVMDAEYEDEDEYVVPVPQVENIGKTIANSKLPVLIVGGTGSGKCLGKGTKVLMFDGTLKPVENVVVGDLLMGDDSTPRKVLSLARGVEQMYWIRQTTGIDYRVNESHILSLQRTGTKVRSNWDKLVDISVSDYLQQNKKFKHLYKGYKAIVDWAEQPVSVDPYFLGLWLGDGSSECSVIHNPDQEIIEFLRSFADRNDMIFRDRTIVGKCPSHNIVRAPGTRRSTSIQSQLSSIGVLRNKHIPHEYIQNSAEVRLALLAGILDTDGHLQSNCFEIIQKREVLIRQVKFLADSLGFKTCLSTKIVKGETYWRLNISGHVDKIPTQVQRKQATPRKQPKDPAVSGIRVEKDTVDEYFGFQIDGNGRFLLEDCTVTHNTSLIEHIIYSEHQSHPESRIILLDGKPTASRRILGIKTQRDMYYSVSSSNEIPRFYQDMRNVADMMAADDRGEHSQRVLAIVDELNNAIKKARQYKLDQSLLDSKEQDKFNYSDGLKINNELIISQGREKNCVGIATTHTASIDALGGDTGMRSNNGFVVLGSAKSFDNIEILLSGSGVRLIQNPNTLNRLREQYEEHKDLLFQGFFALTNIGGDWRLVRLPDWSQPLPDIFQPTETETLLPESIQTQSQSTQTQPKTSPPKHTIVEFDRDELARVLAEFQELRSSALEDDDTDNVMQKTTGFSETHERITSANQKNGLSRPAQTILDKYIQKEMNGSMISAEWVRNFAFRSKDLVQFNSDQIRSFFIELESSGHGLLDGEGNRLRWGIGD